jgi:hypothetical protein
MKRIVAICILTLISLSFFACEKKVEDELLVKVEGYVYSDSTMSVPVENVQVRIRVESGEYGPDAVTYTDSNGYYSVSFYLGHQYSDNTITPLYTAKVSVQFFYEGYYYQIPELIIERGESYRLPSVHLGMFIEYSGG